MKLSLSVRVVAYNSRAIHAYEKCGFRVEGREREAAFVDGQWHDDPNCLLRQPNGFGSQNCVCVVNGNGV